MCCFVLRLDDPLLPPLESGTAALTAPGERHGGRVRERVTLVAIDPHPVASQPASSFQGQVTELKHA